MIQDLDTNKITMGISSVGLIFTTFPLLGFRVVQDEVFYFVSFNVKTGLVQP